MDSIFQAGTMPPRCRIFWAGDSTVQTNMADTYPQTGLGQALPLFLQAGVQLRNYAVNGRSTKSFINEGRLAAIQKEITARDFLFVQFGHNDEKLDAERRTEPYGSYIQNLKLFAGVARQAGAHPVFITPLYRRKFEENGHLAQENHGQYPAAMRALAGQLGIPLADLCAKSMEMLTQAGPQKSGAWYMNLPANLFPAYPNGLVDNTHLRYEGAVLYAAALAKLLLALGPPVSTLVQPEIML